MWQRRADPNALDWSSLARSGGLLQPRVVLSETPDEANNQTLGIEVGDVLDFVHDVHDLRLIIQNAESKVIEEQQLHALRASRHNGEVVCQHTEDVVVFPDGTRVLASGWLQRKPDAPKPDFGLYLDPSWEPTWPATMLDWPDFGVPTNRETALVEIRAAFERARAGEIVEVACVGGHGRTGTVLACMAVLAGVPSAEAVEWVRSTYCRRAVQEPSQQYWVERYAAERLT